MLFLTPNQQCHSTLKAYLELVHKKKIITATVIQGSSSTNAVDETSRPTFRSGWSLYAE